MYADNEDRIVPVQIPHKHAKCPLCNGHIHVIDGDQMRTIREDHGISLRAMAEDIGVSPTHLSDMERGNRAMSEEIAVKILDAIEAKGD